MLGKSVGSQIRLPLPVQLSPLTAQVIHQADHLLDLPGQADGHIKHLLELRLQLPPNRLGQHLNGVLQRRKPPIQSVTLSDSTVGILAAAICQFPERKLNRFCADLSAFKRLLELCARQAVLIAQYLLQRHSALLELK